MRGALHTRMSLKSRTNLTNLRMDTDPALLEGTMALKGNKEAKSSQNQKLR